jgi:chitinase
LILAFTVLDSNSYTIANDPQYDSDSLNQLYSDFVGLKQQNPSLKTIISMGGWKDSSDGTGKYSAMSSNSDSIDTFVSSVVDFLQNYGFDGFDLDWEYPNQGQSDTDGYVNVLAALRNAFGSNYLLSIATSASTGQGEFRLVSPNQC